MSLKTKIDLRKTSNLFFPGVKPLDIPRLRGFHNDLVDSIPNPEMLSENGSFNYIQYNTGSTSPLVVGRRRWNDNFGTTELRLKGGNVTLQDGQELVVYCYNNNSYSIGNGKAVIITSGVMVDGQEYDSIELAVASNSGNTLFRTTGVATENIPPYSFGFVTVTGRVNEIDLTSFEVGEVVYLSQTVPGDLVSYGDLNINGRVSTIGKVLSNSSSGSLRLTIQNESGVSKNTLLELNVLNVNNSSTGVYYWEGISENTSHSVDMGQARGWIVDNETDSTNPVLTHVFFPGRNNVQTEYRTTSYLTYFLLSKEGELLSQSYFPTPQERKQNIFIGKIAHPDKSTITSILNFTDHNFSPLSQVRDYLSPIPLINNGVMPYVNSNLTFGHTSGTLHGLGINFITNILNPNQRSIAGNITAEFKYRSQLGTDGIPDPELRTQIDPTRWDDSGVITLVGSPAKQATNQRIYLVENGELRVQYGQTVYGDLSTAILNASRESFTIFPPFKEDAILIGILSIVSNATNLANPLQARILTVSKFGETIGVGTSPDFYVDLNTLATTGSNTFTGNQNIQDKVFIGSDYLSTGDYGVFDMEGDFSFASKQSEDRYLYGTSVTGVEIDTSLSKIKLTGNTEITGSLKVSNTSGSVNISEHGISLSGSATVFDDLTSDITRAKTIGTRIVINDVEQTIDMVNNCTLTDYIIFSYQMKHSWKLGSLIYPHIHWEQAQNARPNFLIQYRWQDQGGIKTTAWSNYLIDTNAFPYVSGTLNQISHNSGLTPPPNAGLSDIIQVRVIRDTNNDSGLFPGIDPYIGTVSLTAVDIHIEVDTLGSNTEYTK